MIYFDLMGFVESITDRLGRTAGAGEGNRTLVFSMGSCCSTIELHPHISNLSMILAIFHSRFDRTNRPGPSHNKRSGVNSLLPEETKNPIKSSGRSARAERNPHRLTRRLALDAPKFSDACTSPCSESAAK